jgi:hypothetical protein
MTNQFDAMSGQLSSPAEESNILGKLCAAHKDIVFMMASYDVHLGRPDLAEFVSIAPRSLSTNSMTFYCIDPPTSESIVLLMGKLDLDPIYVSATVASCTEGFWERKRRYLVGCDLVQRI